MSVNVQLESSLKPAETLAEPEAQRPPSAVEALAAHSETLSSTQQPPLRRLWGSMASTGGVRLASATGTLVLTVVLARVLSVDEFGRFSFCFTSLLMLSMVSRWGAENALMRFAGSAWHRGDRSLFFAYCRLSLSRVTRNSILLTLVGWPLLSLGGTAYWDGSLAMAAMLTALLPWSLVFTFSFIFKAAGQPQTGSLLETGSIALCGAAAVAALHLAGWRMTSSGVAFVLSGCAVALVAVGAGLLYRQGLWPPPQRLAPSSRESFWCYSGNLMSITLMHLLANWGGTFMLEFAWNQHHVAMFASAARLAMASTLLVSVASLVVGPRLSAVHDCGDHASFRKLVSAASLVALAVGAPLLLVFLFGSRHVMGVLGETYAANAVLLSTIAAGHLVGLVFAFAPVVLAMSGQDRALQATTLFSATICIAVTAALALPFGAWGAAVGAGVYPALQNATAAVAVRRSLGFWSVAGCHRLPGACPQAA